MYMMLNFTVMNWWSGSLSLNLAPNSQLGKMISEVASLFSYKINSDSN